MSPNNFTGDNATIIGRLLAKIFRFYPAKYTKTDLNVKFKKNFLWAGVHPPRPQSPHTLALRHFALPAPRSGHPFEPPLFFTSSRLCRSYTFAKFIIIIIIYFVHKKMYIKHTNITSEQDNNTLRSTLAAALSTIIAIVKININ